MVDSYVRLKPAIVQTLINHDAPVEFSNLEWQLLEKVVRVLRPFVDATQMLSQHDASISMAIPVVTSIMASLDVADADNGVKQMKRNLKTAMQVRFADMEKNDDYAVATLLDCKWKKHFYRDAGTLPRAKSVVVDTIVEALRAEQSTDQVRCA